MKLLLTGGSGNIGSGVLEAALRDPTVTSIVALSRRELPIKNTKLKTITHEDFSHYSNEILDEALGCDGAIWQAHNLQSKMWCLGVLSHQDKTQEEKTRITIGSITAFLDQFIPKLMAAPARDKPWRLIWLGGQIVVRDQDANVWILSNLRKEFGKAVNKIASYADKTDGRLQIYFSHVGFVYQKGSWNAPFQRYVMRAIRKDEHGYALLDVLEHGHSVQDMFNGEMKRLADQHVRSHGLTW